MQIVREHEFTLSAYLVFADTVVICVCAFPSFFKRTQGRSQAWIQTFQTHDHSDSSIANVIGQKC